MGNSANPRLVLVSYSGSEETFSVNQNTRIIMAGAFSGATVSTVTIPASVVNMDNAFVGRGGVIGYIVADENQYYKSVEGSLYTKDGKTLIAYLNVGQETTVTLPDGVEVIGSYAFYGSIGIEHVNLPDSVLRIEEGAFAGIGRINMGNGVTYIGRYVFIGMLYPNDEVRIIYRGTAAEFTAIEKAGNWNYAHVYVSTTTSTLYF